jgi:hypothetical protein
MYAQAEELRNPALAGRPLGVTQKCARRPPPFHNSRICPQIPNPIQKLHIPLLNATTNTPPLIPLAIKTTKI